MSKFRESQRVNTPMGQGVIDVLPYNEDSDEYIVWLDRPYVALGTLLTHFLVCPERHITAVESV